MAKIKITQTTTGTEETAFPLSIEQFMTDMETLAEDTENLPLTSITYSREEIYFDHN